MRRTLKPFSVEVKRGRNSAASAAPVFFSKLERHPAPVEKRPAMAPPEPAKPQRRILEAIVMEPAPAPAAVTEAPVTHDSLLIESVKPRRGRPPKVALACKSLLLSARKSRRAKTPPPSIPLPDAKWSLSRSRSSLSRRPRERSKHACCRARRASRTFRARACQSCRARREGHQPAARRTLEAPAAQGLVVSSIRSDQLERM